jgi:sugar lactone lactonase YvrE
MVTEVGLFLSWAQQLVSSDPFTKKRKVFREGFLMKKFLLFLFLPVTVLGAVFLNTSCNKATPSSPGFEVPIQTIQAINPTLTGTPTFTFTTTPTITTTPTSTGTPTPFPTYTWPGVLTFKHPGAVAVDTVSGPYVYVADTGNNKVEKYTSSGTLVSSWGDAGKGKGSIYFPSPQGVAVDSSENLYVVGAGVPGVSVYNSGSTLIHQWTNTTFSNPRGVAVDSVGNIYVSDSGNNRIVQLNSSGVTTGFGILSLVAPVTIGSVTITSPVTLTGIAVTGTSVYIATQGSGINGSSFSTVLEFDKTSGNSIATATGFVNPSAITFDSSGNLYVADGNGTSGVIDEFAPGSFQGQPLIFGNGSLVNPTGVAVDGAGNIYVTDSAGNGGNGSVVLFAP